eukprot:TRINITY_DN229_c0_g1_i1.p1 TRINITY_DN229_c0_g1~~TRINITY_DN229_c0_g1_i1.p1  ORF type:complete len:142 (+),score=25.48 TRINITY_DN229_c0_g1_i1:35-427(+)
MRNLLVVVAFLALFGFAQCQDYCSVCQLLVGFVEDGLGSERTRDEIEQLLDEVCDIFPGTIQTECMEIVANYTEPIIEGIIQNQPPKAVCVEIELCSGAAVDIYPHIANKRAEGEALFGKKKNQGAFFDE